MPAWDGLVRVLVAVTGRNELRSEQLERIHRNMGQLTGGRPVVGSLKSSAVVAVA